MAVTMEMCRKLVVKSTLHLQTDECVTLAIKAGGRVNGVQVFNSTANYYRNEHPISPIINTHKYVAKFINTEYFVLFVTGDVNKRDA